MCEANRGVERHSKGSCAKVQGVMCEANRVIGKALQRNLFGREAWLSLVCNRLCPFCKCWRVKRWILALALGVFRDSSHKIWVLLRVRKLK